MKQNEVPLKKNDMPTAPLLPNEQKKTRMSIKMHFYEEYVKNLEQYKSCPKCFVGNIHTEYMYTHVQYRKDTTVLNC